MKRLFIAVDLADNEDITNIHREVSRQLGKEKIKWSRPENLHLTLQFLGSTPAEKVAGIKESLTRCARQHRPVELTLQRVGIFGSRYKPRVIWLGFEPDDALGELARCIHRNMEPLGFPPDRQNFVPHLTLGRIREIQSRKFFQSVLDHYAQIKAPAIFIDKFYLYESVLHKSGPEYSVVGEFELGR